MSLTSGRRERANLSMFLGCVPILTHIAWSSSLNCSLVIAHLACANAAFVRNQCSSCYKCMNIHWCPLVSTGANWCPPVPTSTTSACLTCACSRAWLYPPWGEGAAFLGHDTECAGWSEGPAQHRCIHSFLPLCTSCQCVISESPVGIKVRWKSLLKLKMGKGLIDPCARNAVHDLYVHSRQTYAWTHVCTHIHAARTHTHTHTAISPATM